jgi:membrane protein DedA with SNARE-associated domain
MQWRMILHIKLFLWLREPFAALISLATLQYALDNFGYAAVALFIMVESSGIPFPGETMLLLASFYAAVSHQLQIPLVIACAAFGAIIGDNIGYAIGRSGGRALVVRYGKYVFIQPEHLTLAEAYFAKHGNKTVFFGRFIALLRAWAAFLAGVNHMHWRTFLFYNAVGGILWATIYGTIGYIAGRFFHDNFAQVERLTATLGWIGTGLIVLGVLVAFFILRVRRHKFTEALAKAKAIQENDEEDLKTTL